MDACCGQLYEQKLKMDHPNTRNITYDVSDLFRYIDSLADLSALVYNPQIRAYEPYNKEWIKNRVFAHLKKQAANYFLSAREEAYGLWPWIFGRVRSPATAVQWFGRFAFAEEPAQSSHRY